MDPTKLVGVSELFAEFIVAFPNLPKFPQQLHVKAQEPGKKAAAVFYFNEWVSNS